MNFEIEKVEEKQNFDFDLTPICQKFPVIDHWDAEAIGLEIGPEIGKETAKKETSSGKSQKSKKKKREKELKTFQEISQNPDSIQNEIPSLFDQMPSIPKWSDGVDGPKPEFPCFVGKRPEFPCFDSPRPDFSHFDVKKPDFPHFDGLGPDLLRPNGFRADGSRSDGPRSLFVSSQEQDFRMRPILGKKFVSSPFGFPNAVCIFCRKIFPTRPETWKGHVFKDANGKVM